MLNYFLSEYPVQTDKSNQSPIITHDRYSLSSAKILRSSNVIKALLCVPSDRRRADAAGGASVVGSGPGTGETCWTEHAQHLVFKELIEGNWLGFADHRITSENVTRARVRERAGERDYLRLNVQMHTICCCWLTQGETFSLSMRETGTKDEKVFLFDTVICERSYRDEYAMNCTSFCSFVILFVVGHIAYLLV